MKNYYVSDRIKNIFFTNKENLKQYYKKTTSFKHPNNGIKELNSQIKLEMYVIKNRTHINNIWSEL